MRTSDSQDPANKDVTGGATGWVNLAPRLAWGTFAISFVLVAVALFLQITTRDTPLPAAWGFRGFAIVFGITFALVGAIVASRRPSNIVGWLLCGEGLVSATQGLVFEYAINTLVARPGALPGGQYIGWVDNWFWVVGLGVFGTLLPLLFPNGRLLSPRWRAVVWFSLGSSAVGAASLGVGWQ